MTKRGVLVGVAILIAVLVLSACGSDGGSSGVGEGYGQQATQAAEYLCEEEGGVASVAAEDGGWLDYIVCGDGTVHSWEDWEE